MLKKINNAYSTVDAKSFIKPKEAFIDLNSEHSMCD